MNKISVVMATCNGARYLSSQIDSILNQTLVPDELIIVDDFSDDESYAIVQAYQDRFPDRVRVFQNTERLGVNKNFEKAATLATGELIFFSDQDDIWEEEKIEVMVAHRGGASLLYSSGMIIGEEGEIIHENELEFLRVPAVQGTPLFYQIEGNSISGHNVLATRELVAKAIPFCDACMYDKWLGLVACLLNGIRFLDLKLVRHRMHGSNAQNNPELRKRNSDGKKSGRLMRFREDCAMKRDLLRQLFRVPVGEFPHKDLLQLYVDHLETSHRCFFNRTLYRELLKHNYGGWLNLSPPKLRKRIRRIARGELYYRIFFV
ncbi:hypothetical protein C2E25_04910 [Geothermobacter hydrogeniphilus]|uniref:Glycosyltransferase 2-like domain-containing protein n=1 Tax=Geothermobacter hydrogeniphilus TaxID=1969733 RepID=A0A2K2HCG1_9BACT|nr:glycosyltransferase [Geothermobacter hydrogeniphilus]PNU20931.1 hypothetical protein C2E25_04910 [Geothermobacter hydrogeniphilus]